MSPIRPPGGGDAVRDFKQENDRTYFHFLKGNPGYPEDQGLWGGKPGDRKVSQSWYSSAESFDGALNDNGSREAGEKSTDLREMWEDELLDLVTD